MIAAVVAIAVAVIAVAVVHDVLLIALCDINMNVGQSMRMELLVLGCC